MIYSEFENITDVTRKAEHYISFLSSWFQKFWSQKRKFKSLISVYKIVYKKLLRILWSMDTVDLSFNESVSFSQDKPGVPRRKENCLWVPLSTTGTTYIPLHFWNPKTQGLIIHGFCWIKDKSLAPGSTKGEPQISQIISGPKPDFINRAQTPNCPADLFLSWNEA